MGQPWLAAASVRRVRLVCASPDVRPRPEAIGFTLRVPEVESGLGVVLPLSPQRWTSAQPLSETSGPRLVRATENPPFPAGSRIGAPRFELGTSSPPDCASAWEGCGGEWLQVDEVPANRALLEHCSRFPPCPPLRAFGQRLGNVESWLRSGPRRDDRTRPGEACRRVARRTFSRVSRLGVVDLAGREAVKLGATDKHAGPRQGR